MAKVTKNFEKTQIAYQKNTVLTFSITLFYNILIKHVFLKCLFPDPYKLPVS